MAPNNIKQSKETIKINPNNRGSFLSFFGDDFWLMTLGKVREILFKSKKCGQHIWSLLITLTGPLWDLSRLSSILNVCRRERSAQGLRIRLRINTFSKPHEVKYWTVEQGRVRIVRKYLQLFFKRRGSEKKQNWAIHPLKRNLERDPKILRNPWLLKSDKCLFGFYPPDSCRGQRVLFSIAKCWEVIEIIVGSLALAVVRTLGSVWGYNM